MRNQKLQCLLLGRAKNFRQLAKALTALEKNVQFRSIEPTKKKLEASLKLANGTPLIVFVSEENPPHLKFLASLIRQHCSNAIVVIVAHKSTSFPIKTLYFDIDFTKLNMEEDHASAWLHLKSIVRAAKNKLQFRQCKRLLATAEQRNIRLLDSSTEAIAYISTDTHYYANTAYLALFDIDSLQDLNKLTPKELIVNDEVGIFDAFLKYQAKHHRLSHILLLSMKSLKHDVFRANMRAIPSVYKGKKCWQVWVYKVNRDLTENNKIALLRKERFQLKSHKNMAGKNPFDDLDKTLLEKKKKADIELILKGIIKRQEAQILALKLTPLASQLNKRDTFQAHYHLSLKIPIAQKKGTDDLLSSSIENNSNEKRQLFWDKVKIVRLKQLLSRKNKLSDNYIIGLSRSSVASPEFTQWILKILDSLGVKSRNLTLLIPSELEAESQKTTLRFIKNLKSKHCKIALNDFSFQSNTLKMIRFIKPDFVRLSLAWLKEIELSENKISGLSNLLRQLEKNKIQVIAPCVFSEEMRKMFVFSGVSFCQERTTKSA